MADVVSVGNLFFRIPLIFVHADNLVNIAGVFSGGASV